MHFTRIHYHQGVFLGMSLLSIYVGIVEQLTKLCMHKKYANALMKGNNKTMVIEQMKATQDIQVNHDGAEKVGTKCEDVALHVLNDKA